MWILPAAFLILWMCMVAAAYVLSITTGRSVVLCAMKRYTGHPCAACGGTRATVALLGGELLSAWYFNPLVTVCLILVPGFYITRMVYAKLRKRPINPMPLGLRRTLLVLFLIAFACNWWYVLANQREIDSRPSPRLERYFGASGKAHALPVENANP